MGVSGPNTVSTWAATTTGEERGEPLASGKEARRLPTESNSWPTLNRPSLAAMTSERSRSWNGGAGTRASSICSSSIGSACPASQSRARVNGPVSKGRFCSIFVGDDGNFGEASDTVNARLRSE